MMGPEVPSVVHEVMQMIVTGRDSQDEGVRRMASGLLDEIKATGLEIVGKVFPGEHQVGDHQVERLSRGCHERLALVHVR